VVVLAAPRLPRPVETTSATVEECIAKNIHGKGYDSLAERDTRRRLIRLQVKADCEQQLAAR
jgi:hypothetical protein